MPYTRRSHGSAKTTIQVIVPKGTFIDSHKLKQEFPYMMNRMREDALDYWNKLADHSLNRSREKYKEGITSYATNKDNFVLSLQGRIPNMIENGWSAYDMKDGFSKSPKLKTGKMKIPKDKRSEIESKPSVPFKWMIIPINLPGELKFRMYTTKQGPEMWQNDGFKGVKLMDKVDDKIVDELIEKHVDELLRKLYG